MAVSFTQMVANIKRISADERSMLTVRAVIEAALFFVVVYLCFQTDQARLKGTPMEPWRLIPLVLTATVCALLGKRFLNSVAGLFLGGIGGAFGTLDNLAGPYGGVVGLLIGAIVVAIPIMHKPAHSSEARGSTKTDGKIVEEKQSKSES